MFAIFKRGVDQDPLRTAFDEAWEQARAAATSTSERAEIDAIFARHR